MGERTGPSNPDCILGIDEAGRGSLVGPLVVGGFLVPKGVAERLVALGVKDSKLLSPERRTEIYGALGAFGRRLSVSFSPSTVDRYVATGRLNRLEAEAFARLVRRAGAGVAYVDACDPVAERFGTLVGKLSGGSTRIVARHRADRDLPVVGAASIVAKVRRDRAIEQLRVSLGTGLGSGYPSDERTVAFVRAALESGGPAPSWVRASWQTTERLMRERSARTLESFA
ncbi:MAG: ribonuclease HII [Thermoplasmata archaeon]|nr:ribonuclease HII [Thermoplasmata archaeon]